uniref:Putative transmembrane protein n=1 Tax=Persimmon virus B TaxID=1493829 RepID=A0A0A8JCY0_9CLOS|nr:putative transmembrane protein [Persimmon virus B]
MEFSVLDLLLIVLVYICVVYFYDYYLSNYNKFKRVYAVLKDVKQDNYRDYLELSDSEVPSRRERRRRSSVQVL